MQLSAMCTVTAMERGWFRPAARRTMLCSRRGGARVFSRAPCPVGYADRAGGVAVRARDDLSEPTAPPGCTVTGIGRGRLPGREHLTEERWGTSTGSDATPPLQDRGGPAETMGEGPSKKARLPGAKVHFGWYSGYSTTQSDHK